jgi:hypothetical protein
MIDRSDEVRSSVRPPQEGRIELQLPPEAAGRLLDLSLRPMAEALGMVEAAKTERIVRAAVTEWLPARLGWLVDRPRLLRLYLRLPHRTRPEMLAYPDGRREMVLR